MKTPLNLVMIILNIDQTNCYFVFCIISPFIYSNNSITSSHFTIKHVTCDSAQLKNTSKWSKSSGIQQWIIFFQENIIANTAKQMCCMLYEYVMVNYIILKSAVLCVKHDYKYSKLCSNPNLQFLLEQSRVTRSDWQIYNILPIPQR